MGFSDGGTDAGTSGGMVSDSRSIDHALPEEICEVVETASCRHFQLGEAQTHQCRDRGWQHQYRYDPKARQRH
ncbi:MAG: hypothetical protein ACJA2O_002151 [Candidatus Azotimanducaceae bacterium]